MKISEVRELEAGALAAQSKEAGEQMFHLRMKLTMGHTEALKNLRLLRKDRARMATVARERQLSAQKGGK
jgi:large subunit ribosomal protein L29